MLTGPNGSGKSCFLKQAGLIAYMAHLGSFVPAESALVGDFDRIFSRIGTNEAAATDSTFSVPFVDIQIDCQQIAVILKNSTANSLVLIDEFGKGTNTLDGQSLLAAVLAELLFRPQPPLLVLCTHFFEILEWFEGTENIEFLQMDFLVRNPSHQLSPDTDDIVFLFKAVAGRCLKSFGTYCAAKVPSTNRRPASASLLFSARRSLLGCLPAASLCGRWRQKSRVRRISATAT